MRKLSTILLVCLSVQAASARTAGSVVHKADTTATQTMSASQAQTTSANSSFPEIGLSAQPPQVMLPSPQSQIYERYLKHEVSEYNGLPEISIPLYEIEIKGMKIPIALTYHAGGVKFLQYDGDVGAGWSINVGGYRISSTAMGKLDGNFPMYDPLRFTIGSEFLNDCYAASIALGPVPYPNPGYVFEYGIDRYLQSEYHDGAYDHHTYMTPSGSGQYIVDSRNNGKIYNTNPLFVINHNAGTITDNNGFIYFMGKNPDPPYDEAYESPDDFSGSALLTKIQSPYNEYIRFYYKKPELSNFNSELVKWVYMLRISDAPNLYQQTANDLNDNPPPSTFSPDRPIIDIQPHYFWRSDEPSNDCRLISEIRTDK